MNGKESYKIILLESLISIVILFSFYLDKVFFDIFKIFGGILIVSFTLFFNTILEKIIRIGLFYSMEFILSGIVNSFNIKGILILFIILCIYFFFLILSKIKNIRIINNYMFNIVFNLDGKIIKLKGYLDSGNFSNYNEIPIIYINQKYYNKFYFYLNKKELITIKKINKLENINIYQIKNVFIEKRKYDNIYISFSNNISFDCLLNIMMSL